ncbi:MULTISPECIES: aminotransferase class V-fold PLP-dependent enzyme [unclassified Pedobacter]|uniref:aminotransferase class V-fold PLP-dependent enzyme n=1 Tax=unclassified Pedobacter TaxID=2628915 RepID=UPI001422C4DA|nr:MULTISPECIES: aminotransferase class V-fold PLP-dependent enzyme [unclassified Pedobacter]NII83023.1 selenocysteine lyase/cysteine desulfurase [Pedobacter sp. SG908]NMN37041.1 selenocysteine lyase/cysteine desulfurase [Pedobacter sp. SG918]
MNLSFPILKEYTYLNTANSGILSTNLAEWRTQHDEAFTAGGSIFRMENLPIITDLRNNITTLFGSKPENTYLVQNFSVGFNILLSGLDKSHRFLLLEEEYPSVSYPVISTGFDYHSITIDEKLEENIINAIEKFKPTVLAFSMVQYISGFRMDDDFIQKLKTTYPNLLLIGDGTQFLGTTTFNFEKSGLDALIGSGYKWLLAGYGNGYAFLSDQMKDAIYAKNKLAELPTAPFLKGKDHLSMCFEPGHLDTLNFGTLNESLNYLASFGFDRIEKITQKLSNQARLELNTRGLVPDWILDRKYQSTIMSMPLDQNTVDKLAAAKILCSPRGTGTRISFHYYNTEEDLNYLLQVLDNHR